MNMVKEKNITVNPTVLAAGDAVVILLVAVIGFLNHQETPFSLRIFTTLLPLWVAWGLQAPWLGLFQPETVRRPLAAAWRAGLAAVLSVPLAALLRSLMLRDPFIDIDFVLALTAVTALGMILWRLVYAFLASRGRGG